MRTKHQRKILLVFICLLLILSGCKRNYEKGKALSAEGTTAFNSGNASKAIEKLEEALEAGLPDEDLADVYNMIGLSYADLQDYEKALTNYQSALKADPKDFRVMTNMGISYRLSRQYEKAEESYRNALAVNPDYPEAHSSLGTLYIIIEKPAEAIPCFERALEIKPTLAVTHGNLALAYAMVGRFEDAEASITRAEELGYRNAADIRSRINALKK